MAEDIKPVEGSEIPLSSEIPEVAPAAETAAGAASASKKPSEGLLGFFYNSEKSVKPKVEKLDTQILTATGDELEKLTKKKAALLESVEKLHWGKVGGTAAVAAVTALFLAGLGNKGPGEKAAAIEQERAASRDQQPAPTPA